MVEPGEKALEEPQQASEETREVELDVEVEANAFVRQALKGLIELIKHTKDQELIRITHGYIHCLKNFYTLAETVQYMTSTTSATVEKVTRCYQRCISDSDLGGKAYLVHSARRETMREAASNVQKQQKRQASDSHMCETDSKVGTSHTSKVKRKPRKR